MFIPFLNIGKLLLLDEEFDPFTLSLHKSLGIGRACKQDR